MAIVKEEVNKIEKRDKEMSIRTLKTKEYFDSFVNMKSSDAVELKKKLEKLDIPRLKEEYIVKIIDILPANEEVLKSILQGYIITITKENMHKIIETVKPYIKQK